MGMTIIHVDLDPYVVPVTIEYVTDVDQSYGEDADGQRATVHTSCEILDIAIDADHLKHLSVNDAEYVLDEARYIFANQRHA